MNKSMQKSTSFSSAQKSPPGPSRTSSGPLRPSKCMLFLKENNTFRKATFSLRVASRIEKVSKTTSKWLPDGAQNDQKCIQKRSRKNDEKTIKKLCQNDLKMEPKSLLKVDQKSTKIDPRAQEVPFGAPGPHFGGAGPHF